MNIVDEKDLTKEQFEFLKAAFILRNLFMKLSDSDKLKAAQSLKILLRMVD